MKNYNFKKKNKKIYKKWINKKYFYSKINNKKKPYYLLLPPPNITGDLHIGHVLNFTILDIYARFKRMKGYNVCWIPCTDHASIATEIKIIKILKKKGINIKKINKKKIKKIIFKWAKKYNNIIIKQLKYIGCSCDWSKFQFTMDKKNYYSVIKVFINLYNKGLIYKKKRIINWDICAKTTISDEEVIYKKKYKNKYYIKYFLKKKKKFLIIPITRLETIFGNTAICVNPNDIRYKNLINKKVIVPIVNRKIPIITDNSINKNLDYGCFKLTPAHSEKDFKIYNKNKKKIKIINIFNKNGTLCVKNKKFNGKNRFKIRKSLYNILKKLGYLIKKKKEKINIGYSERTNTIIEKRISLQWYLKIKKFIKPTINKINNIKILPNKKYKKLFFKWLKEIKDWNISRQLIWGQRIPIYYFKKKKIATTSLKKAIKIIEYKYNIKVKNKKLIKQDKNVLDTWFSSWILPISFLNGIIKKENNNLLNYYFPIDILITGYDILFFWVLRMIMFSLYYKKKIPFKNIYFIGIARDKFKKKLSKSLGNYKNLYFLLNKYGTDGLRIGLLSHNFNNDFFFNENLCLKGRNLVNKIWNTFKFINKLKKLKINNKNKIYNLLIIKWFNNLLNYNLYKINKYLNEHKIYKYINLIKKLFIKKFCSILLEYIKINNYNINKNFKNKILNYYNILLKILHPIIPFITEYIYTKLNKKNITISKWPKIKKYNKKKIKKFNETFKFINYFKKIKLNKNKIKIYINKKNKYIYNKKLYIKLIYKLTFIKNIKIKNLLNKKKYLFYFYKNYKFYIKKKYIFLNKKKLFFLNKQIFFYNKYLLNIKNKLKNKSFLLNAPKKIINLEKKKKKDIKKKIINLKKILFSNNIF
ncbi:MAG: valine--tRNA ligase [Candidatus Shikimatogenerans sp. JK-2022]|nr:valine--tRNA ligase [Candidatus Shikimatogenerans bostrichidophilus]